MEFMLAQQPQAPELKYPNPSIFQNDCATRVLSECVYTLAEDTGYTIILCKPSHRRVKYVWARSFKGIQHCWVAVIPPWRSPRETLAQDSGRKVTRENSYEVFVAKLNGGGI